jgi:hypothetical protein
MENERLLGETVPASRKAADAPAARIPLATYRLQFNRSFTFADAARLVSYLHALGVSDCYASPYFKACPDSSHGYDVIDHGALNPEVGSKEDYVAFARELRRHDMGQLLDVVPNHMGIARNLNLWWADVLENGPSSLYASCFDIDWTPVKADLANKVLLPILGDQYGRVLENQELILSYEDGAFALHYYDHRLPIAPRPSIAILSHRLGDLQRMLGAEHPDFLEFQSIITALTHLPLRTETDRDKVIERSREKEIVKKRLASLTATCPAIRTFIEENVRFFNGVKGDRRSFDPLDALLADQAYRLAYWRVAAEEINYRRFFDVNELAAIRTEDPTVFAATHQLVLRLLAEGVVTGLRIDHVDGLYDPAAYLLRLQQAAAIALREGVPPEPPSPFSRRRLCATQRERPPTKPRLRFCTATGARRAAYRRSAVFHAASPRAAYTAAWPDNLAGDMACTPSFLCGGAVLQFVHWRIYRCSSPRGRPRPSSWRGVRKFPGCPAQKKSGRELSSGRSKVQRVAEKSNRYAAPSVSRGMIMSMRLMVVGSSRGRKRVRSIR